MSERQGIPNRQAEIDALQRRFGRRPTEPPTEAPAPEMMEMLVLFAECLENVMDRLEQLERRVGGNR